MALAEEMREEREEEGHHGWGRYPSVRPSSVRPSLNSGASIRLLARESDRGSEGGRRGRCDTSEVGVMIMAVAGSG